LVRKRGFPVRGELIVCETYRLSPFAAWCKLREYPHLEGIIHISEAAGKWIFDIREVVKQGKQYVAKVLRIDEKRNLVNLSLKRVSKRDRKEKMNIFRKEERAEKILEQAASSIKKSLDQAYEEVGFLLQEKFGDLYTAFEEIKKDPKILDELKIDKKWSEVLLKIIESAFKEKEITIKVDLELKSYASDGVDRIKKALIELGKKSNYTIKYISAPRYMIEIRTKNPKNTQKKMKEDLDEFISNIKNLEIEGSYKFVR
jgi:translation initiation factor 2 subunit 1